LLLFVAVAVSLNLWLRSMAGDDEATFVVVLAIYPSSFFAIVTLKLCLTILDDAG
jgi:hypothetical protein